MSQNKKPPPTMSGIPDPNGASSNGIYWGLIALVVFLTALALWKTA